ncbi:MAG: RpiB/LacA/LacB family sugar-phosphate isomerase [Bacilli bacterium]
MKIAFGCDHGGFIVKDDVIRHLKEKGYEVLDFGTFSNESCNYPDFAFKASEAVASKEADKGILICSSGEGVSICANKVKGIRCGIGYNDIVSNLIVEHNHCNMIAFGAKYMALEDILRRIDIFLSSIPQEGRHQVRVDLIDEYEKKSFKD